jgi:hypothetical protein
MARKNTLVGLVIVITALLSCPVNATIPDGSDWIDFGQTAEGDYIAIYYPSPERKKVIEVI